MGASVLTLGFFSHVEPGKEINLLATHDTRSSGHAHELVAEIAVH